MTKAIGTVSAILLTLSAPVAFAADNPLIGTWKLKSYVREVAATGERTNERGEHPNGYLGYAADARMYAIITWENRIKPREVVPTDEERIKLFGTMISYAGTYTFDAEKSFITSIFPGIKVGPAPTRCVSTSSTATRSPSPHR